MPKQTLLYDRHVALGGRMVAFAGWMLPVQYPTGPKAEHLAVRQAAGLFDIDHMGQVEIAGPDALAFMQHVMTADFRDLPIGGARYSLLCYADGTVVDDTFTYRLPDRYFVAINAANVAKDLRWLRAQRGALDVTIKDVSEATYMLSLQGPRSQAILQPLCAADLGAMALHTMIETDVAGAPTRLGRTGYTGEDGFELYFAAELAPNLWDTLLERGQPEGLLPIGLAARDSLRFEPCMPLYGQEISAEVDPLSAGLSFAVAFDKGPFIGRDALLKVRLEGPRQRLVGLEMIERGVPRHGYPILAEGQPCGVVTSGMYAPSVDKFLALGYVPAERAAIGTELAIQIREDVRRAVVVKKPFYTPTYRR